MQAAACATSLTPGTRSSRAISEACSEAGTAAAVPAPASSTALVSSSTNSGTPSVRAAISPSTSGGRPRPPARRGDDRLGRAAAEAVERQPRHVRVPAQAGLVVGPAGQQHQHPRARDPVEGEADQLQRGGVDPVGVLEHHQHRPAARQPEQLLDQAASVRARRCCGVRSGAG